MNKSHLLAGFVGRGVYWGLAFGCVLSVIYNLILFQFSISIFMLFYALVGAVIGAVIGGINGLVLGLLSPTFSQTELNEQQYRRAVLMVSIGVVFTSSALIFSGIAAFYAVSPNYSIVLLVLLPGAMAALAAAYASQAVASWYIEQQNELSQNP